jgi:hypothetical protein
MNWIKLSAATTLAAALIAPPATAYADCGQDGQDPCSGPVPTVDQVVAVLAGLTDPDIPAANKGNVVTPGFSPDEAGTIDDHLQRMDAHGRILPLPFIVTDIQAAPNNLAGATVATQGDSPRQNSYGRTIVLADQGRHWLLTHDSAMAELDVFWRVANRYVK